MNLGFFRVLGVALSCSVATGHTWLLKLKQLQLNKNYISQISDFW